MTAPKTHPRRGGRPGPLRQFLGTLLRPVALAAVAAALTTSGASAQMFGRQAPVPPVGIGAPVQQAQSSAAYAEQSMRIDQMQDQMRQLNGQIEQLTYQVQQLQELLRRSQEDTEFRFQQLEGKGRPPQKRSDAGPAAAPPLAPSGGAASVAPPPSGDPLSTARLPEQNFGAPPAVLGTIPGTADAGAPASGSALGGPLDLSAIARGDQPAPGFGSPAIGGGDTYGAAPSAGLPGVAGPAPGGFGGTPVPNGATAPSAGGDVAALTPPADPKAAYDSAYGAIVSGDYAGAETRFKQFIAANPSSDLAPSAHFWLGESYFARDRFREAADAFLTTYRDYPRSQKAAESLLKLGLSLEGLGERDAACATYGELRKKYPSAPGALLDRASAQRTKAGC